MKKVFALCGAVLLIAPALSLADNMTVQVQNAKLRSKPSFIQGKTIAKIPYRSVIDVLEDQGDWGFVKYKGRQGWVNKMELQTTSEKLSAGIDVLDSAVSSREVSLAGKGFNQQVENAFKAKHQNLRFDLVNKMEKPQPPFSRTELEKFAAASDFSPVSR